MIITFAHPKGGVGKTTLAFNFAYFCMKKNYNVSIIDLDAQNSITYLNELRERNNRKKLNIKNFTNDDEILHFLQNSIESEDIIIIDTGGFDSSLNRIIFYLSDILLTPVSDTPIEIMRLFQFDKILHEISNSQQTKIKAKIIFNRLHPNLKHTNQIEELFENCNNLEFLKHSIKDRSAYKYSLSDGSSIFEVKKKDSKSVEEFKALSKEILGKL